MYVVNSLGRMEMPMPHYDTTRAKLKSLMDNPSWSKSSRGGFKMEGVVEGDEDECGRGWRVILVC